MGHPTALRDLIDEALEARGTDLPSFIDNRTAQGKNMREIRDDLEFVTGVRVSWRTLYRWTSDLKAAS